MHILYVIPSLNPKSGGPAEGVIQISRIHKKNGNIVEAVTFDEPSSSYIKDLPLKVNALGRGFGKYQYKPGLDLWLRENCKRFDVVIINGLWQYHALSAWKVLHNLDVPYFVYTHGMLDPWFKKKYPLKHLKKTLYWMFSDYKVLRDAKAVLFTSEEEKKLAPESFFIFKANSWVVKYGAATPPADRDQLRQLFFKNFNELKECRCFLFLSRIHEKKGCDLLIRAFSDVCKQDDSLRLVMAGPDQTGWANELKRLACDLGISRRIVWTGMLQGDLKWGAFYASELFVLPSHQENFGIAVAESLGCGLPVLISNKVNIWREIKQDGVGLVENDDLSGTAAGLKKWMAMSVEERSAMSKAAVCSFKERFTVEQMQASLMETIGKFTRQ